MLERIQAVLESAAASAKPGSCKNECEILAGKLFVETGGMKGGVRADCFQVGAKHYHLRVAGQVLDPTVYQFFNVPPGFQGKVLLAIKERFIQALRELQSKFGYSRLVDPAIKSAE